MFTGKSWYYCLFLFKGLIGFAFVEIPKTAPPHTEQRYTDDLGNGFVECSSSHLGVFIPDVVFAVGSSLCPSDSGEENSNPAFLLLL